MRGALLNDGRFARWQTSPHLTQALPAAAGADQSPAACDQAPSAGSLMSPCPVQPLSVCGATSRARVPVWG